MVNVPSLLVLALLIAAPQIAATEVRDADEEWVTEVRRIFFPALVEFCNSPEGKASEERLWKGCNMRGSVLLETDTFCGMRPEKAFAVDLNAVAPSCIPDGIFGNIPQSVKRVHQEKFAFKENDKVYYGDYELGFDCSEETEVTMSIRLADRGIVFTALIFVPWSCITAIEERVNLEVDDE
ncbi:hypothetical protein [Gemmobacter denitrificans]|uniref:Uncharacterized protein n=1 Tax=Gemmobacter denitrificans TaxID=3123040 RepID=A0ABU8C0J4_9RHOB